MKNILTLKTLPLLVIAIFCLISLLFFASNAIADNKASDGNYGLDETINYKESGDNESLKGKLINEDPELIAGKIVGTILTWTGVVFMVLIFVAGLTWMTSGGNEQKAEKAKQMIMSAIIGLLVVLAAYAITAYIGKTLVG